MASVVTSGVARFAPVVVSQLSKLKPLLTAFIGLEATETIWELIVNQLEDLTDAGGQVKTGGRGVVMIDLSTGLVIGRTSRRSALGHLEGKKSAKCRRYRAAVTKGVNIYTDGHPHR